MGSLAHFDMNSTSKKRKEHTCGSGVTVTVKGLNSSVFIFLLLAEWLQCVFLCSWQSFSNADLVDDEPAGLERDGLSPHWKCYAKYISHQQILLTFLPATFTGASSVSATPIRAQLSFYVCTHHEINAFYLAVYILG